ncbi:MAG TPA: hypothetical protein DCZ92_15250 [Elusimicrobia bacterium]|nr:MAG: hypothetical protein A2016_03165 [Elusimicrobia bacterium GWF2_62_30]HBA62137.1 hypothetical protein [Elusimicrobiota bacterium]
MPKLENQARLVTALRAFTGKLPPGYADEKEFFLTSLQTMTEYLSDLQKETLQDLCDNFTRKLDAGKVTMETISEFKAGADRLISAADFRSVSAGMAGSKEFVKKRLLALAALSMIGEELKASGRDPDAERRITETYSRLGFPALAKKVEASPDAFTVGAALSKAREEVAAFCCLYRVPMGEAAETLTPFSLSCVDAALAASYRLFKAIRHLTGRSM